MQQLIGSGYFTS